jgi:hypothetical protein
MKEAISKAPSGRPKREPVGLRNRLKVHNEDPNYKYRWVVDYDGTGDRIEQFKESGYEVVPKGLHKVGDARVNVGSAEGSSEVLSVGGGQKAVLMRQKREWYDEDQKAKAARVDETEKALKNPKLDGSYGNVSISSKNTA